jgi:hypothetical protein
MLPIVGNVRNFLLRPRRILSRMRERLLICLIMFKVQNFWQIGPDLSHVVLLWAFQDSYPAASHCDDRSILQLGFVAG